MTSLAGTAGLLRTPSVAAEGPLETRSVRLPKEQSICVAPQDVVDELLRAEGFSDIRHVPLAPDIYVPDAIAQGTLDFGMNFATVQIAGIDRGIAMRCWPEFMSAASSCSSTTRSAELQTSAARRSASGR